MTDLDIDIWGTALNAAGRTTLRSLKANYPYIEITSHDMHMKLWEIAKEHVEPNHYGQLTWRIQDNHIFFQSKEDAEFCRACLYIY